MSEAEREYTARAGTTTAFWWGSLIWSQANYNSSGYYTFSLNAKTVPVDSFVPNPWGLFNVHGNVWEWTEDCWHDSYHGAPLDASAWKSACRDLGQHVVRGGAWYDIPQNLRVTYRKGETTGYRSNYLGFRLARTIP